MNNSVIQKAQSTKTADAPSISYRYPTEWWLLFINVLIIGAALITTAAFSIWGFVVFFIFMVATNSLVIHIYIENFKRQAVEVTDEQFPEIKSMVDECRQYINVPPDTRVFVSYDAYMNAFAMGLGRPYVIILFSALVENMDRDELKFIIAHEMGHIKFGHTIWLTLIGELGRETYGIPVLRELFYYFFLYWSRTAEKSADRAGLVGNGRLDKSISALVKFSAGPILAKQIDLQALARQAHEADSSFWGAFIEATFDHPTMTTRVRKIVNFAYSDTFRHLRPEANPRRDVETHPVTKNESLETPTRRQFVIRPLAKKIIPSSAPEQPISLAETTAESSLPPPTKEPETMEWGKQVGFHRLNIAAVRANAEQADMWLKMGELLQEYNQADKSSVCLQRVESLMSGSTALASLGKYPLQPVVQSAVMAVSNSNAAACPNCDTVNPTGSLYCHQCQTQLRKPCLSCETWLPGNYVHCTNCGQNQAEIINNLKTEAAEVKTKSEQPLPPRGLSWTELIFGVIFLVNMAGVMFILYSLADEHYWRYSEFFLSAVYIIPISGVMSGFVWARWRVYIHWAVFDEVNKATRRYNEIATTLVKQNVRLTPPQLVLKDPWQYK